MKRRHRLYPAGCIYNILGSNPNTHIPVSKYSIIKNNSVSKPMTRVRTKPINRRRGR